MPLTELATKTSCYDFCSPRKQRNIVSNMKNTVHSFSVPLKKYYSADLLAPFSRHGWTQGGVEGWDVGMGQGGGVGKLNCLLLSAEVDSRCHQHLVGLVGKHQYFG